MSRLFQEKTLTFDASWFYKSQNGEYIKDIGSQCLYTA